MARRVSEKKKNSKKNIKQSEDERSKTLIVSIFTVIILFTIILTLEYFLIGRSIRRDSDDRKELKTVNINDYVFNTTNRNFTNVDIGEIESYVGSLCSNGCNLKTNFDNNNFYYVITYINNQYYLTVALNDKILLRNKYIGINVENAYIKVYDDYPIFYNLIISDTFSYDYVVVSNSLGNYDEFISLEGKEMEFNENGIAYYYDQCLKDTTSEYNSYKIKVSRKPFDKKIMEIERQNKFYQWCTH